jgi:hypothetical protein
MGGRDRLAAANFLPFRATLRRSGRGRVLRCRAKSSLFWRSRLRDWLPGALEAAGVIFDDENDEGPAVRLRKTRRR